MYKKHIEFVISQQFTFLKLALKIQLSILSFIQRPSPQSITIHNLSSPVGNSIAYSSKLLLILTPLIMKGNYNFLSFITRWMHSIVGI